MDFGITRKEIITEYKTQVATMEELNRDNGAGSPLDAMRFRGVKGKPLADIVRDRVSLYQPMAEPSKEISAARVTQGDDGKRVLAAHQERTEETDLSYIEWENMVEAYRSQYSKEQEITKAHFRSSLAADCDLLNKDKNWGFTGKLVGIQHRYLGEQISTNQQTMAGTLLAFVFRPEEESLSQEEFTARLDEFLKSRSPERRNTLYAKQQSRMQALDLTLAGAFKQAPIHGLAFAEKTLASIDDIMQAHYDTARLRAAYNQNTKITDKTEAVEDAALIHRARILDLFHSDSAIAREFLPKEQRELLNLVANRYSSLGDTKFTSAQYLLKDIDLEVFELNMRAGILKHSAFLDSITSKLRNIDLQARKNLVEKFSAQASLSPEQATSLKKATLESLDSIIKNFCEFSILSSNQVQAFKEKYANLRKAMLESIIEGYSTAAALSSDEAKLFKQAAEDYRHAYLEACKASASPLASSKYVDPAQFPELMIVPRALGFSTNAETKARLAALRESEQAIMTAKEAKEFRSQVDIRDIVNSLSKSSQIDSKTTIQEFMKPYYPENIWGQAIYAEDRKLEAQDLVFLHEAVQALQERICAGKSWYPKFKLDYGTKTLGEALSLASHYIFDLHKAFRVADAKANILRLLEDQALRSPNEEDNVPSVANSLIQIVASVPNTWKNTDNASSFDTLESIIKSMRSEPEFQRHLKYMGYIHWENNYSNGSLLEKIKPESYEKIARQFLNIGVGNQEMRLRNQFNEISALPPEQAQAQIPEVENLIRSRFSFALETTEEAKIQELLRFCKVICGEDNVRRRARNDADWSGIKDFFLNMSDRSDGAFERAVHSLTEYITKTGEYSGLRK